MDDNIEEVIRILNTLVSLVYDLAPDDEYMDMYGIVNKIAQAQAWVDKQAA
jgi:hypothetical protein